MNAETRKRLLALWERVPETRPDDSLDFNGEHFWVGQLLIPDDIAALAAAGKLCEWLGKRHVVEIHWACAAKLEFTLKIDGDWHSSYRGPTLLDALLAAASGEEGGTK